jgi:hypothetical protein
VRTIGGWLRAARTVERPDTGDGYPLPAEIGADGEITELE